jgi:hypothetical protein
MLPCHGDDIIVKLTKCRGKQEFLLVSQCVFGGDGAQVGGNRVFAAINRDIASTTRKHAGSRQQAASSTTMTRNPRDVERDRSSTPPAKHRTKGQTDDDAVPFHCGAFYLMTPAVVCEASCLPGKCLGKTVLGIA